MSDQTREYYHSIILILLIYIIAPVNVLFVLARHTTWVDTYDFYGVVSPVYP